MGVAIFWLLRGKSGPGWCFFSWSTLLRSGWSSRWCRLCAGAACQPWRLLEEFPLRRACLAALFALEIWTLLLCPRIFQLILAFGCCLWSTAYWIFREILRAPHLVRQWIHVIRGLWKNLHIFNVAVNSNPEAFALHSAEWRCVHSRCFWLQLLSQRGSHVGSRHYFYERPFF